MQKNTNILFVLEGFFPDRRAGTEIYVLNLIKNLPKEDYNASVLISTTNPKQQNYNYEGINVYVFHVPKTVSKKELNGLLHPSGITHFKKHIIFLKPDIVHFHSFGRAINTFHLEWLQKQGIKTVFTAHLGGFFCVKGNFLLYEKTICDGKVIESRCLNCYWQNKGIPKPLASLAGKTVSMLPVRLKKKLPPQANLVSHRLNELKRVKKYCDAIIAIAPWIKNVYAINGLTEKVHLVKQGIELAFEKEVPTKNEINYPIKLGFIGRMHPSKGFHLLKQALENTDDSKYELFIYSMPSGGEVNFYNKNKNWATARRNVFWHENIPHQEIMQQIEKLDLLILPSVSNEMAPLVILEAFSAKVPVLGSTYPAIKDIIADNVNGRLFKNNSVPSLKQKLLEILNSPEILVKWSKNINQVRSNEDVAEDMIKIYEIL